MKRWDHRLDNWLSTMSRSKAIGYGVAMIVLAFVAAVVLN
jgi:hypothetical protein